MTGEPDPGLMARFCWEVLPELLIKVCDVAAPDASQVAEDILLQAEAAASLGREGCEVLAAPFFEESFAHEPDEATPWMKAITTLVIRNSQLEELHAHGPVNDGGLTVVTTHGLGPLSHLLAARRQNPLPGDPPDDRFADLAEAYPRAWACLTALRTALDSGGGQVSYRLPDAPVPSLPGVEEVTEAQAPTRLEMPSDAFTGVVLSGIDPRFDQNAIRLMEVARNETRLTVGLSSLSRISRNSRKLLRVLEFFLTYQARILTTNYLLTGKNVSVRRRGLVKPDSVHPMEGFYDLSGISGSHKKTVEAYIHQIA